LIEPALLHAACGARARASSDDAFLLVHLRWQVDNRRMDKLIYALTATDQER